MPAKIFYKLPDPFTLQQRMKRALAAKELQAQQPGFEKYLNEGNGCLYSAPCIIGAALPKTVRKKLDNLGPKVNPKYSWHNFYKPSSSTISELLGKQLHEDKRYYDTEEKKDSLFDWLDDLQSMHDSGYIGKLRKLLTNAVVKSVSEGNYSRPF